MKTSKILSAVLVGTLIFGLTACGGNNTKKDDTTKETETEIEETVDETTVEETEDEAKDSPETDGDKPTSRVDGDVDHHGGESDIPDEHYPTNPDTHYDEQGEEAKDTTPDTEVDSHYFDEDGRVKDN